MSYKHTFNQFTGERDKIQDLSGYAPLTGAIFTGNVTAPNLDISNWNTAYGWGNHASAGYLTSFTSLLSANNIWTGTNEFDDDITLGGSLGIGTTHPLAPFHLLTATGSSYGAAAFGNTIASSSGGGAGLFGYSDDGAAMANGDRLGYLIFAGAKGTDHSLANACAIIGYAIEDWTGSSARSKLSFETVASGTTARGERAYINDTEFNVGSGKFFLDIANKKLGIGTTTPFVSMEILNGTSGAETEVIQLRSGKTAAGSGSSIRWVNSTSNNSTFGAGELAVIRTNAVSSGDSDMIFRLSPAGSLAEYLRIKSDKTFNFIDGGNIVTGTTTGMKIGTGTTQKLAFHNSTPTVQRAGAAQALVSTTASTQATPYGYSTSAQADGIVTLLNEIQAVLVEKGLMKGSA